MYRIAACSAPWLTRSCAKKCDRPKECNCIHISLHNPVGRVCFVMICQWLWHGMKLNRLHVLILLLLLNCLLLVDGYVSRVCEQIKCSHSVDIFYILIIIMCHWDHVISIYVRDSDSSSILIAEREKETLKTNHRATFYSVVMEFLVVIWIQTIFQTSIVSQKLSSAHKNRWSTHLTTRLLTQSPAMQSYKTFSQVQWGV